MTNNYKLYYFNVTGLAEPIRYLLSYVGIPFDDIRFKDFDEWEKMYKKDMPMEQVPVLEINGVKYRQHESICRYLAKKNNLCGTSEEETYEMDAIVEDINDIRLEVGIYYKEKDPALKDKQKKRALEKHEFYFNRFESRVESNNGFFVGNKLSWADIYYAAMSETMSNLIEQDLNKDYPNLKKLANRIRNHMMIAPYIAKRPETII